MKTLYLISTSGVGDFHVIAEDPTTAENILKSILDKCDYGFSSDRRITSIKIIDAEPQKGLKDESLPHLSDKSKRLILASRFIGLLN